MQTICVGRDLLACAVGNAVGWSSGPTGWSSSSINADADREGPASGQQAMDAGMDRDAGMQGPAWGQQASGSLAPILLHALGSGTPSRPVHGRKAPHGLTFVAGM